MKSNQKHDELVQRDNERESAEVRKYIRRLMAVTVSIAVLGLSAVVAAIVAYQQQQKARDNELTAMHQENRAKEESAKAYAAEKRARDQESRVRESFSQADFYLANELSVTQQRQEALAFLARAIRSDSDHYAVGRRILYLLGQHSWFLPKQTILGGELEIWDVKYLSATQIILLTESQEGVAVYSAESGQPLFKPIPLGGNNDARFSDDGHLFFTQKIQSPVHRAAFSPDGNLVLATCHDGTFLLIDGKHVEKLASFKQKSRAIDFSPTGQEFVLGNMRWSAVGHPLLWIEESADHWCPGATPSSGIPASATQGFTATRNEAKEPGTVTIRTARTKKWVGELPNKVDHIAAILGDRLITNTQTRIQVWDLATLRLVGPPIDYESIWDDKQVPANFHPDGNRIVTVVDDKAQIWDASTGKALTNPIQLPGQGGEPSFSPDGTCLLVEQGFGAVQDYVRLWDTQSGGPLSEIIDYPKFTKNESATICSNGMRLGIPSERGFVVFDLPGANSTVPGWLADLAEAIGGLRVTASSLVEALSTDERASIMTKVRRDLLIGEPDAWVMFGRWFLDEGKTRLVSPYSSKTTGEYMQERLNENTTEALELATNVAPADAELFIRLAKKHLANAATEEFPRNDDIRRAQFWILRARALDPSIKVPVAASRFIGGQTE